MVFLFSPLLPLFVILFISLIPKSPNQKKKKTQNQDLKSSQMKKDIFFQVNVKSNIQDTFLWTGNYIVGKLRLQERLGNCRYSSEYEIDWVQRRDYSTETEKQFHCWIQNYFKVHAIKGRMFWEQEQFELWKICYMVRNVRLFYFILFKRRWRGDMKQTPI